MEKKALILALNPGSTSTKLGLFQGGQELARVNIAHPREELAAFSDPTAQLPYRRAAVEGFLAQQGVRLPELAAVVSRGGVMRPLPGGPYRVNAAMIADLLACRYGTHPCNLGAALAAELAVPGGALALVVDAPSSDEFQPLARLSGLPELPRRSSFHFLNQRAVGRRLAHDLGLSYSDLNLIGTHLGGGISVAAHARGRLIDANNALDGDGPFSPQRAGTLPTAALVDLCFSGRYSRAEIYRLLTTGGGLTAYLGTQDAREVEARIAAGDENARLVYEGMAYQVAKEIGAMATVLKGQVDAIFFTGGLAHSELLLDWIKERVRFIAPLHVYPGEDELLALAEGALAVLEGRDAAQEYVPEA